MDVKDHLFPIEVLLGHKDLGPRVVVVGGGVIGCETALHTAEALKRRVTVVEMQDDILLDMEAPMNVMTLRMKLQTAGVEIRTGLTLKSCSQDKVICLDKAGKSHQIDADSVVLALGLRPKKDVAANFEELVSQVFMVGDCVQPKDIFHAFSAAWQAVFSF